MGVLQSGHFPSEKRFAETDNSTPRFRKKHLHKQIYSIITASGIQCILSVLNKITIISKIG